MNDTVKPVSHTIGYPENNSDNNSIIKKVPCDYNGDSFAEMMETFCVDR